MINLSSVLFFRGRLDEALPWSQRGFELAPTAAIPANLTGIVYDALGDTRRAEASFRRALELQPDLGQTHARLINFYLRHRRDREALEQARRALRIAPFDPWVMAAGEAELIAGDPKRARELFEQILPLMKGVRLSRYSGAGVETHLAYLSLQAGRHGEAKALLAESLTVNRRNLESGNQDWGVPFDMACVHALRGEKDEAFRWLEQSVQAGWRGWPLGTRSPLLDPLRSDERLGRIEARVEALVGQMRRRAGLG